MYIGNKRSVRSQLAIENFELPLSLINKDVLDDFKESIMGFDDEINKDVFNFSVSVWKKLADKKVNPSSWHHTGKYYNRTNHYDLYKIALYLTEHFKDVKNEYNTILQDEKKQKKELNKITEFGLITVNVWGGTRSHPKIIDQESAVGYIIKTGSTTWLKTDKNTKYNVYANKVVDFESFDNLKDLKNKAGKLVDLRKFKKFLKQNNVEF